MQKQLAVFGLVLTVLIGTVYAQKPAIPEKQVVFEGLLRPWSMAFISEYDALVAEKDGSLVRINLKSKKKTTIRGFPKDLAGAVKIDVSTSPVGTYPRDADGKTLRYNVGIFQVLLDPEFSSNKRIYVSYVSKNQSGLMTTKVIRARLSENRLTDIKELFVATPYERGLFHFGGAMVIGPDKKLYFTVGDRQFSEALQPKVPFAQNVKDRRGKVYRINLDGSIPKDNPDFGADAVPGIYALGIRASQGLTVEPKTGTIWFSEHGTLQGDELNILRAGANYGWPVRTTGRLRAPNYKPADPVYLPLIDPVWYWRQTVAPTGLTFYSGNEFPQWNGNLFVSGLSRGSFWRIKTEGETVKSLEELFVDSRVRSRNVVQSPGGVLYLLTSEENGKILRIKNSAR